MILKNGYVAIKPFTNTEKIGSIFIKPIKESSDYMNIMGEVVACSDDLPYKGREAQDIKNLHPIGDNRPAHLQEKLALLNNQSLSHETQKEIKKGDIVIFDWKQRKFNEDSHGELLIMKYDQLYMLVSKDGYKMLNGWLLVVPNKEKPTSNILDTSFATETQSETIAEVKHEGSIVTHYLRTPYCIDLEKKLVGKKVLVRKQRMNKLEKNYLGLLDNPDYHLIQRKDILGYEL